MPLCQLQYIRKSETPFNVCISNHRKDIKSQASILTCKHFNEQNRNFEEHAKFTLIEQIKKQTIENRKNKNTFKTKRKFLSFKIKYFISRWVKSRIKQN